MEPRVEVETLLRQHGAVLKRDKKHEVWELPDGKKFTRAKTPSDIRSDANNLSDLKKLLRTEKPANGGAVMSQPVRPPVAAQAKVMRKVEKVLITPQQAASWLELNVHNRPMRDRVYKMYAEDMRNGRWMYNFQPIIFSSDNTILDGQHRLKAVVESNVAIQADVVFDAPPEIMSTVDIGMARTVAHMAALEGVEYASHSSVIARMVLICDTSDGNFVNSSSKVTKPMVLQFMIENSQELADICRATDQATKLCSRGPLGCAYVLFKRANPSKVGPFFEALGSGIGITEDSPIYRLRERLISNRGMRAKISTQHILALTIKAWNLYVAGKTCRALAWGKESEAFPKVQG